MIRNPGTPDRMIDEALRGLTDGAPREGFRGRVLARIAESSSSPEIRILEISGWRLRPLRLATAGALAVLGLATILVMPTLIKLGGSRPAVQPGAANRVQTDAPEGTAGAPQPRTDQRGAKPVPTRSGQAQQPRTVGQQFGHRGGSSNTRATVGRYAAAASANVVYSDDVSAGFIPPLGFDLVPAHAPVEITPIELRPIEIPELTIPTIEVAPIESVRTPRAVK